MSAPTIVLLHGLWMGRWQLELLARRLRGHGFVVKSFSYSSITERFAVNLKKLHRFALAQQVEELHFVGHSLGGLLAARMLADQHAQLPPGRLLALGTPLNGCHSAGRVRRFGLATLALGFAEEVLAAPGLDPWTCPRQFGVIAGRVSIGANLILRGLEKPNDGTVAVSETRIAGLTDHVVIGTSHTGLVFSREAADLGARFLRSGSFSP